MEIIPSTGNNKKLYKITEKPKDIYAYDTKIQKVSYIIANLAGIFEEWFLDFFDDKYFKTKRIQTQSNYSDFKGFVKDIYLKEKPMLLIVPEIELVEDSFYNETLSTMYNKIDANDEYGSKLLYSTDLIKTEKCSLLYRRNRYRVKFDIMMVEKGLNRQIDLYNYLVMNLRHNSKFPIEKKALNLIPLDYIENVAMFNGYDYRSLEFMEFINKVSYYPIIKRITPSKHYMFFMAQDISINVSIPDMPARDGIENNNAIEKGGRVVDRIEFETNLPAEFLITIPQELLKNEFAKYDTPEDVYYIAPIKSHPKYPVLKNGFLLSNIVDVVIQNKKDNTLDMHDILDEISTKYKDDINQYISNGLPITDVMHCPVFESGTFTEVNVTLDGSNISIVDPDFTKVYSICVYINNDKLNFINGKTFEKHFGDIVDY